MIKFITVKNTRNGWQAVTVRQGLLSRQIKAIAPPRRHKMHAVNDCTTRAEKLTLPIIL